MNRGPIERRLKGEVKIGKWDQLSTYGLIEHSERVHKKLNKFIREYQGDVLEYPLTAVLRRELVGDLASEQGDLKAAVAVPPATSVFPMLKSMGELMHLQTQSLPPKPAKPESQLERQAAHEESISAMVVMEQKGVDSGGSREKVEEVEEEEEEDEEEIDFVADCAEELLAVAKSMQGEIHSMSGKQVTDLLSTSTIININNTVDLKVNVNLSVSHPRLLKSAMLSRNMDEYLRSTLVMESMGSMTRAEKKAKDPSFFLMSARYAMLIIVVVFINLVFNIIVFITITFIIIS